MGDLLRCVELIREPEAPPRIRGQRCWEDLASEVLPLTELSDQEGIDVQVGDVLPLHRDQPGIHKGFVIVVRGARGEPCPQKGAILFD
jgi:hypothetical protein